MDTLDNNPDIVVIPLTRGLVAVVSLIDKDLLDMKWHADRGSEKGVFYASRNIHHRPTTFRIYMHRMILERILGRPLLKLEFVDHIDRNGLNNRRENLRLASRRQNNANVALRKDNPSGYKGVYIGGVNQDRFKAVISNGNGGLLHLGSFSDPISAARAYDRAAYAAYGEFAYLNFPNDGGDFQVRHNDERIEGEDTQ